MWQFLRQFLRLSRAGAPLFFALENLWLLQGLDPELEGGLVGFKVDCGVLL